MAIPKITDAQMQYYQFKARQAFLLQKENHEWEEFCKKSLPCCSTCVVKEDDTKASKDIGIQTSQKNLPSTKVKSSVSSPFQNHSLSETLSSIKLKLEKIDLALSDMKGSSEDKAVVIKRGPNILYEHIKTIVPSSREIPVESLNMLDDTRRQLIQSSLKSSLQRLKSSTMGKSLPVSGIKMKNSSFFLPHDLKKQRLAARKAYLASLPKAENKPSGSTLVTKKCEIPKTSRQSKKQIAITKSKQRKNPAAESETKLLDDSTLVETDHLTEIQDENIEKVLDGILNDLIGEAALSMYRIKERKKEKQVKVISSKLQFIEDENVKISKKWAIPSSSSQTRYEENKQPHLYLNSQPKDGGKENERISEVLHRIQRDKTEFHQANESAIAENVQSANKQTSKYIQSIPYKLNMKPYVELSVDSDARKRIMKQKKLFWRYLESISRTEKGGFNPWNICDTIAEVILDECIVDVSKEVGDVPQSFISDLYNQEFIQMS